MSSAVARALSAERLVERLRADGLDAVWVDRAPVFDRATLLHAIYQALRLPAWFGFNWDALADVLCGPEGEDAAARVLVFADFELLEERDPDSARIFLEIVADVAANPACTLRGMMRSGAVEVEAGSLITTDPHQFSRPEVRMSVAKVSEISATSKKSFEDAIEQGLARASKTIRNIRSAWIKEQQVRVENGKATEYQVNMMVTFIIDD
jgi:dodecin